MNHGDSDFRYMALNDLIADLQTNKSFDEQCQKKIVQELLRLLKDSNGEVQNLAVKWYAFYIYCVINDHFFCTDHYLFKP